MKPYGKGIIPDCSYCAYSSNADCRKKAEEKGKNSCRRFLYDPLLRKPKKAPALPTFSPEDFKL